MRSLSLILGACLVSGCFATEELDLGQLTRDAPREDAQVLEEPALDAGPVSVAQDAGLDASPAPDDDDDDDRRDAGEPVDAGVDAARASDAALADAAADARVDASRDAASADSGRDAGPDAARDPRCALEPWEPWHCM